MSEVALVCVENKTHQAEEDNPASLVEGHFYLQPLILVLYFHESNAVGKVQKLQIYFQKEQFLLLKKITINK